jgi:hypothetical protein
MMSIYEEPPMYTDQMGAMPDYSSQVEVVIDPADTMTTGSDADADSVTFDQATEDSLRAREERRRRERQNSPPVAAPPVRSDTPRVRVRPPPAAPPTPPPDTAVVDSVTIR